MIPNLTSDCQSLSDLYVTGDEMACTDMNIQLECRTGCAACCIAPSISSAIPGMESGKPAGVRCIQLSDDNRCLIFSSKLRPAVCGSLRRSCEMCGSSAGEAMQRLAEWEQATRPQDG